MRTNVGDDYISVDIEGPHRVGDDLRQLGACNVRNTQDRFFAEFYTVPDWNYPDQIIQHESQALGFRRFADWVNKFHHPVHVSFNSWDWIHIYYGFQRHGIPNPFGQPGRSVDIKVYYMGLIKREQHETNKRDVVKLFPSIQKHTHNGLDDAIEQAEIFAQMLDFRWNQLESSALSTSQQDVLLDWLRGRRGMIEDDIEDLGLLKPLLTLLEEKEETE